MINFLEKKIKKNFTTSISKYKLDLNFFKIKKNLGNKFYLYEKKYYVLWYFDDILNSFEFGSYAWIIEEERRRNKRKYWLYIPNPYILDITLWSEEEKLRKFEIYKRMQLFLRRYTMLVNLMNNFLKNKSYFDFFYKKEHEIWLVIFFKENKKFLLNYKRKVFIGSSFSKKLFKKSEILLVNINKLIKSNFLNYIKLEGVFSFLINYSYYIILYYEMVNLYDIEEEFLEKLKELSKKENFIFKINLVFKNFILKLKSFVKKRNLFEPWGGIDPYELQEKVKLMEEKEYFLFIKSFYYNIYDTFYLFLRHLRQHFIFYDIVSFYISLSSFDFNDPRDAEDLDEYDFYFFQKKIYKYFYEKFLILNWHRYTNVSDLVSFKNEHRRLKFFLLFQDPESILTVERFIEILEFAFGVLLHEKVKKRFIKEKEFMEYNGSQVIIRIFDLHNFYILHSFFFFYYFFEFKFTNLNIEIYNFILNKETVVVDCLDSLYYLNLINIEIIRMSYFGKEYLNEISFSFFFLFLKNNYDILYQIFLKDFLFSFKLKDQLSFFLKKEIPFLKKKKKKNFFFNDLFFKNILIPGSLDQKNFILENIKKLDDFDYNDFLYKLYYFNKFFLINDFFFFDKKIYRLYKNSSKSLSLYNIIFNKKDSITEEEEEEEEEDYFKRSIYYLDLDFYDWLDYNFKSLDFFFFEYFNIYYSNLNAYSSVDKKYFLKKQKSLRILKYNVKLYQSYSIDKGNLSFLENFVYYSKFDLYFKIIIQFFRVSFLHKNFCSEVFNKENLFKQDLEKNDSKDKKV